uniref:Uncharacterized protein n=1 Tax=viral metagenome TaxID=1070528 RepID=A0A6M3M7G3_9ZZZZ
MRKIRTVAVAIGMLGILLAFAMATAAIPSVSQQPQQDKIDKSAIGEAGISSTLIPGEIFTGDYLRIGINNAGSLGVGDIFKNPGVGFQWAGTVPYNPITTESAAIWFWGEGYKIAYKEREGKTLVDTVAWYQPSLGGFPPAPETNIVPVSEKLLIDDKQKAVKEIKVKTKDNKLLITFLFTFLKQYPELNLETTIKNTGKVPVRDVVYTRIVDWDVCTDTYNNWASTGHEAYAWGQCDALKNPLPIVNNKIVQLTIAGHDGAFKKFDLSAKFDLLGLPLPVVNYVDLNAWDDMEIRSPGEVVQSFVPILGDYNAGVYYKIGELKPRESKTVYTVYQSNFPRIKEYDVELPVPFVDEISADEETGTN